MRRVLTVLTIAAVLASAKTADVGAQGRGRLGGGAPTPASAHATLDPTENQCDCTATPISPVAGSRATME